MSIYGISPLGTDLGPFGGPGVITVLGVLVARRNQIIIVWDREPELSPGGLYNSALTIDNYALTTVDRTITAGDGTLIVPDGANVPRYEPRIVSAERDPDDDLQTLLNLDANLEIGVDYELEILLAVGANGETFAGPSTFEFNGIGKARVRPQTEPVSQRIVDIARVRDEDGALAEFAFEPSGDFATDSGDENLSKRIERRFATPRGGFTHQPDYGIRQKVKANFKPSLMGEYVNEASDQLSREPDIDRAAVSIEATETARGVIHRVNIGVAKTGEQTSRSVFDRKKR